VFVMGKVKPRMCAGGIEEIADPSKLECLGLAFMQLIDVKLLYANMVALDGMELFPNKPLRVKKIVRGSSLKNMKVNFKVANIILRDNKFYFSNVIFDKSNYDVHAIYRDVYGYTGTLYKEIDKKRK